VAPGIPDNRPASGKQPVRHDTVTKSGFTKYIAQTWYDGLEVNGNTTLNPFFYGTYLGETKPEEPVHRTKKQVFQADAVGAMHQLTPANFHTLHTFRLEWQPGPGGRLDWFAKDHRVNSTFSMSGDGMGQDWVHAFSIKDESLNITGAQIPAEPSYLIMNTGISSTWGFPDSVPDSCAKCYDCNNATCACSFNAGFCNMMKEANVAMYIDYVRLYQSDDDSAHVGQPHSVGCDPVGYPTKEFIKGNEYRYMRGPPFGFDDTAPLEKKVKNGGGKCTANADCGGGVEDTDAHTDTEGQSSGRGECEQGEFSQGFFKGAVKEARCKCYDGYTGPFCLANDNKDDAPGAMELRSNTILFENFPAPTLPIGLIVSFSFMMISMILYGFMHVVRNEREFKALQSSYTRVPDHR